MQIYTSLAEYNQLCSGDIIYNNMMKSRWWLSEIHISFVSLYPVMDIVLSVAELTQL